MTNLLMEIKPGQAAALGAAVCWTLTALCFEYSSKKVGSLSVNILRLYLAFILFTVFSWIFRGRPFPTDASAFTWFWLGLSGVIGFVVGDLFLFKALTIIGARMSMLIMALVPLVTAVSGFFILSETLSPKEIIGMALTLSGVAIVILTRGGSDNKFKHPLKGVIFATVGMLGQAVGIILSKYGMGEYNAFAATHIRVIAGVIVFTVLFFYLNAWGKCWASLKNKSAMGYLTIGAVFGPFIGVYLSLLSCNPVNKTLWMVTLKSFYKNISDVPIIAITAPIISLRLIFSLNKMIEKGMIKTGTIAMIVLATPVEVF